MTAEEEATKFILEKKHNKHVQMLVTAINKRDRARRELEKLEANIEALAAMNVEDIELDQGYINTYTASSFSLPRGDF